jgi:hypothetical protein
VTKRIATALALAALAGAAGCGGSQAERAPSAAPSAPTTPPNDATSAESASKATSLPTAAPGAFPPAPAQPMAPPPPPAPAAAARPPEGGTRASLRRAGLELDTAQRELEASAGDCAAACRALGSMERATGHLCDLASDLEDRRVCEEAKTRVQAARDRVRNTCGSCPGGPSVERGAPIPSR